MIVLIDFIFACINILLDICVPVHSVRAVVFNKMDKPKYQHKSGAQKRADIENRQREEAAKKCKKLSDMFGPSTTSSTHNALNVSPSIVRNPTGSVSSSMDIAKENYACQKTNERDTVAEAAITPDSLFPPEDLTIKNNICQVPETNEKAKATEEFITPDNVFPSDYALFENSEISNSIKNKLVQIGACQPRKINFPTTKNRSFSEIYYEYKNNLNETRTRWWLAYSPQKDVAYCHCCWLFGNNKPVLWGDWRHLSTRLAEHTHSKSHITAAMGMRSYMADKSVDSHLKKQLDEEQARWKEVLTIQFDLLRTITSLTLPLRGHSGDIHSSNCGIYLTFIKFLSKYCPQLQHHLESESKIKYLSNTITDEQIKHLADSVRLSILNEIRSSIFWTVIVDGTTDISKTDQVALLIRYVHLDPSANKICVKEVFLEFLNLRNHDAPGYVSLLLEAFQRYDLDTQNLVGQAYDGASVMSGGKNGVHCKLREAISKDKPVFAPYVHCPPHQLNLVLKHAAEKCASVQTLNFFGNVQKCYSFFADSPQRRWALLKEKCTDARDFDQIDTTEVDKEQALTLKSLCNTRWTASAKAVRSLLRNYGTVTDCLQVIVDLKHDGEEVATASGLLNNFDFEFLVTLTFWNDVLQIIDITSQLLQKKEIDLFQVVSFMKTSKEKLLLLRNDAYFNDLIKAAKSKWIQSGMSEENMKFQEQRRRKKKSFFEEIARDEPIINPSNRFKVDVMNVTLDSMVAELSDRIEGLEEVTQLFGFLNPVYLQNCDKKQIENSCSMLVKTFSFLSNDLYNEMIQFTDIYFNQENPCLDRGALGYLEYIMHQKLLDVFPNLELVLRLFITLPVGIASAERCFSVLRRLKTYLRSTMSQERTSNLALLTIEKEVLCSLNLEDIIQKFLAAKTRRGLPLK